MPAKSGVGGGIVAVLPGQVGIGVYSPLLDHKGNSVRGVRVCRSLSEQLGLHFLTVSRESRSTLRAEAKRDISWIPTGVIRSEPDLEAFRFATVGDAVEAAQAWLEREGRLSPR